MPMNTANTVWYTTKFIANSLKQYLKEMGFRVSESDERSTHYDHAIISTKLLSKEIIEIRGTASEASETELEEQVRKSDNSFLEVSHFLLDIVLSPINFFNSMNGNEGDRCVCIPDTDEYRKVLDKLRDYFLSNKLHLKTYLVSQTGAVDVFYLKHDKKRRA